MIANNSIPYFPKAVRIVPGAVQDVALNQHYPMNQTAEIFLKKIDGQKNIATILDELQKAFPNVKTDMLTRDFYRLLENLVNHYLICFKTPIKDQALILFSLFWIRSGFRFFTGKRYTINGVHFFTIFVHLFAIILKRLCIVLFPLNTMVLLFALYLGQPEILIPIGLFDALIFGVFLSIAIHESGHLYALRRITKNPHMGCLVTSNLSYKIRRPAWENEAFISLCGPLVTTFLGISGIWLDILIHQPLVHLLILWMAIIFIFHSINLWPVLPDGKHLFRHLFASER